MAKHSNVDVMRRWRSLDRLLTSPGGARLRQFAKHFGVTVKTIRRDLAAFKAMRCVAKCEGFGDRDRYWRYVPDTIPLFSQNVRITVRDPADGDKLGSVSLESWLASRRKVPKRR